MGYSIIKVRSGAIEVLQVDVLKLSAKKDNYQRLQIINAKVCELITEFKPQEFAIEAPFYGKNVQSMLKLGRAQGVAIAAALSFGIPITEYSPKKVKQSITGNGNADKEQIWKMLQSIVTLPADKPKYFDATDALAVALCHHFQSKVPKAVKAGPVTMKKKNNWDTFVKANVHRVAN
jgi:crossover junction endodeoxyribonuclease RuvC